MRTINHSEIANLAIVWGPHIVGFTGAGDVAGDSQASQRRHVAKDANDPNAAHRPDEAQGPEDPQLFHDLRAQHGLAQLDAWAYT